MGEQVRFTRHARNRLRLYALGEADVLAALSAPAGSAPSVKGRTNTWAECAGEWLRVTWIKEVGGVTVITVTPFAHQPRREE